MSFVWGPENVAFLRARYKEMSAHHCYHGMEYSEDRAKIAEWAPLIIDGRDASQPVAATRIVTGTDVDYGALTHLLVAALSRKPGFDVSYNRQVVGARSRARRSLAGDGRGHLDGTRESVSANFVFIGAGGARSICCRRPAFRRDAAMAAFRSAASGCAATTTRSPRGTMPRSMARPAAGSPPMSVPHLDTRIIDGKTPCCSAPMPASPASSSSTAR